MEIQNFDDWSIEAHARIIEEFRISSEENIAEIERIIKELQAALEREAEEFDPRDDAVLPLKIAVCLPELGGVLKRLESECVPGPTFTHDALRDEIKAGRLKGHKLREKYFTTRQHIKEWLWADRDQDSVGSKKATASGMGRRSKGLGESAIPMTKDARLQKAQASALMTLKQSLKKNVR